MAPSSSAETRTRRHVTTACVPCRESKIKCDGNSPTCSNCEAKGKDCRYQAMDDKRKLTLRLAVDLLSSRIEQLSSFIADHNLQPPDMRPDDHDALKKVLNHLRMSHVLENTEIYSNSKQNSGTTNETAPGSAGAAQRPDFNFGNEGSPDLGAIGDYSKSLLPDALETLKRSKDLDSGEDTGLPYSWPNSTDLNTTPPFEISGLSDTVDLIDSSQYAHPFATTFPAGFWPLNSLGNIDFNITPGSLPGEADTFEVQPMEGMSNPGDDLIRYDATTSTNKNANIPGDGNTEFLLDELSSRIGSLQIGPGGQVRYFGATSNFNLVDMPAPDNLTVHRTVRNDGQKHLECLGMGKLVPDSLEDHLTSLYFAWQDPTFHAVNRTMFESAKEIWRESQEDTPYYSEALQNAICCLGAAFESRYHPTFTTFPKSLSDFFADRAKALLDIELDCPCVATVQAMMVLSSHDIGCKRDSRGWLYSGMAMRLAFDLALHVDMSLHVSRKSLTQQEADLRQDVFWGVYVIDHLWSFHLGRPFRINMEDVTVAVPFGNNSLQTPTQWIPYESVSSKETCPALPDYTDELHRQRVMLVGIMVPLGYALYGNLRISRSKLQIMNAQIVAKLLAWKETLPAVLQVDVSNHGARYLPHVILLHMQYHQALIHAHRPWMSRSQLQPNPPQGPGSKHAQITCVNSALSIAGLIQLYENHYALRRMNIQGVGIVCSAALLLIFATVSHFAFASQEDLTMQVSACFRALDEFGASWESAKRAREFLLLLQRRWERQATSTKVRRASQAMPKDDTISRKRHRSDSADRRNETLSNPPSESSPTAPEDFTAGLDMNLDLDWIGTGDVNDMTN